MCVTVCIQEVGIFCLDPRRVAISGKVRIFALDKTGTLTQPFLDFLGLQPIHPPAPNSSQGPMLPCTNQPRCMALIRHRLCLRKTA